MSTRLALLASFLIVACDAPTAPVAFPVPQAVATFPEQGSITLRWHAPQGATVTRYEVEYSTDAVAWKPLAKPTPDNTSVRHLPVEYKQQYYYRIRACDDATCSSWVNVTGIWDGGIAPSVHSFFTYVGVSSASLSFEVINGSLETTTQVFVLNANQELVWRSPTLVTPASADGFEVRKVVDVFVGGLEEGTSYQVYAQAKNAAGLSLSELQNLVTSKRGPPKLSAPFNYLPGFTIPFGSPNRLRFPIRGTVDPGGEVTDVYIQVVPLGSPFDGAPLTSVGYPAGGKILDGVSKDLLASADVSAPGIYKIRFVAMNRLGTSASDSIVVNASPQ